MEYLIELLSSYIQDEQTLRWLFVGMVSIAVFAVCMSIIYLVSPFYNPMRQRLAHITGFDDDKGDVGSVDHGKTSQFFGERFDKVAKYVLPQNTAEQATMAAKLVRAGFRGEGDLKAFYAIKTISCLLFGFVALQTMTFFPEFTADRVLLIVLGCSFVGLVLPNTILKKLEERRITSIRNGFPDALDLFVVCVESGLGLGATIQRVADELVVSHPELAEELALVTTEMRLGVDRITALRGLATRTGLDEIKGLVALLDQSARFGTGIAETLRVYSDEFRDKRMQKAEEIAAKVGTKLIFPLTLCMWPAFFVIAVGPAILQVLETFK